MELTQLCNEAKRIFNIPDMSQLSDRLLEVCMGNDTVCMADFCESVQDLTIDWLQKIFEYYYAERKEKCQDYTPKSIAKLCSKATGGTGGVVYDLCAGSGALTIQKWRDNPTATFICEELDERVIPILLFNMAIRNMNGYVINRNALTMELHKCYRVESGEKFSTISKAETAPDIKADCIISNPPYNIKWDAPSPMFADSRFFGKPIPPASNANYAFVMTALDRLADGGRVAFVLPQSVLNGRNEVEIRDYIVSGGLLERVISLPDRMFENTSIATCVMVFSRGNKTVKLYDLRKKAVQEERKQNGQYGGKSHENRTYTKTVNVIPDDMISAVCGGCGDVAEFSKEVPIADICANKCIFAPAQYITFVEEENKHRPYADIMADINHISAERSRVKITINESLAKQFGLYEVAELAAKEQENAEALSKTFEVLGGKYESKRYITLSKAKNEFKFENQDKEILSSMVNFLLPMWKQHIFYLNEEENRLLVELRDAMLPDLMSGKLEV